MYHLLSADFYRLFKNKLFWLSMAFVAASQLYMTAANYLMNRGTGEGQYYPLTWIFFEWFVPVGFVTALVCAWFVGESQEDGLLRVRLAGGCGRVQMYLCHVVVCVSAGMMMAGVYLLLSCTLGAAVMQPPALPLSAMLYDTLVLLLGMAALCAMFAFLASLTSHRALALAVCIGWYLVMTFVSLRLVNALREEALIWTEQPVIGTHDVEWLTRPNPAYVDGTRRRACIWWCDLLPTAQAMQISDYDFSLFGRPPRMMVFSVCEMVGCTAAGMAAFVRKDVR